MEKTIAKYELYMEQSQVWEMGTRYLTDVDVALDIINNCFKMSKLDREIVGVLAVNAKNEIIGVNTASVGAVNYSIFSPREILKFALLANASGIIITHNHPSGDVTPSREDRESTEKLNEACKILGVTLLDHIIIGNGYYSFKEHGLQ